MKRAAALDLGALGLLAALVLGLCWPFMLGGQTFYYYDSNALIMPALKWSHQCLSAGHFPAWDGTALCGMSALDSSISACFYPVLTLLTRWFEAPDALGLLAAIHLTLAAWGAYALVRYHGLGPGPALVGAVTAAFCGGMTNSPPGWPVLISTAYLPWMLLGLSLCQSPQPGRWRLGAAVLGVATGYCFLGGYPGMGFYALLVLALLQGLWLLGQPRRRLRAWPTWAALALAALIAASLYAGQALALRRGAAESSRRHGLSVEQAEDCSLSPATSLGMVLPHGLGRRADDSFSGVTWRFGTYEPTGMYLYIGLGGLLLMALGLRRRPRQTWPYASAWGLLIFYALGKWNPLFPWILRLPVLGFLRGPDKAVVFGGALAALPVAYGLDALTQRRERGPHRAAAWLAAGLALALLALLLAWGRLMDAGQAHLQAKVLGDPLHKLSMDAYLGRLTRLLANLRWQLAAQGVWAALLALLLWLGYRGRVRGLALGVAVALLCFGELAMNARAQWILIDRSYYLKPPASVQWLQQRADPAKPVRALSWGYLAQLRRVFPQGRTQDRLPQELALSEALAPNTQRLWGLDLSNGYSPLWPARMQPLLGWMRTGDPELEAHGLERLRAGRVALDLSATRWLVSAVPLDLPGLALRQDGDIRIYENLRAWPMAYIAQHSRGGYDAAGAWAALSGPGAAESRWALPALLEDASPEAMGRGQVRWALKSDEAWELDAQVDSAQGVLVLSRAYYPGPWKALVDGQPAELLPANSAFCAVHLGHGRHVVRVYYDDPLLAWGWRLQWAGLALAVALLLWAWRSPKERA